MIARVFILTLFALVEPVILQAVTRSIVSFGAACNGTSNDGPAINATIAASGTGDIIEVPCLAAVATALVITGKTNVTIRGTIPNAGAGFTATATVGNAVAGSGPMMLYLSEGSGYVVDNLQFQLNNRNMGAWGLYHTSNSTVSNTKVYNSASANTSMQGGAIQVGGNTNNTYTGNRIENTASTCTWNAPPTFSGNCIRGMWFGNSYSLDVYEYYPTITNNTIVNTGGTGMAIAGAVGAYAAGNVFQNLNTPTGAALKSVEAPLEGTLRPTIIENNTCINVDAACLQPDGNQMVVRANTINGSTQNGISLWDSPTDVVIRDNVAVNVGAGTNFAGGISLHGATANVLIERNEAYNSGSSNQRIGIQINPSTGSVTNTEIINNIVRNNSHQGIKLWTQGSNSISGVKIIDNNIRDNPVGITVDQITGAISSICTLNNTFTNNGTNTQTDTTITTCSAYTRWPEIITTLPNAAAGSAYNQAIGLVSGSGTGTKTWTLYRGSLPSGVTMNSSGVISGTPTVEGTYTFFVRVVDATTHFDARRMQLVVGTGGGGGGGDPEPPAIVFAGYSQFTGYAQINPASASVNPSPFLTGQNLGTMITGGTASGYWGFRFTTSGSPVTVHSLGRWMITGNNQTHIVKLVLASNGQDVSGGSVSIDMAGATAGQYKYVALTSPVVLSASTAYYIVSTENEAGDDFYDQNTVPVVGAFGTVNASIYNLTGSYATGTSGAFTWGPLNMMVTQ